LAVPKRKEGNWSLDLSTNGLGVHELSGIHTCMKWVDHLSDEDEVGRGGGSAFCVRERDKKEGVLY
jgi:hypothetical protein